MLNFQNKQISPICFRIQPNSKQNSDVPVQYSRSICPGNELSVTLTNKQTVIPTAPHWLILFVAEVTGEYFPLPSEQILGIWPTLRACNSVTVYLFQFMLKIEYFTSNMLFWWKNGNFSKNVVFFVNPQKNSSKSPFLLKQMREISPRKFTLRKNLIFCPQPFVPPLSCTKAGITCEFLVFLLALFINLEPPPLVWLNGDINTILVWLSIQFCM